MPPPPDPFDRDHDLSTTNVESRRGFDYWTEAVSSTFVPLGVPDRAAGSLPRRHRQLASGDIQLTPVSAAPIA